MPAVPSDPSDRPPLVLAVDGPSGSGKSSVSREVARRLGLEYLDTGAMYRAVCWSVLDAGLDPGRPGALADHVHELDLVVGTDPRAATVHVRGRDITAAIREGRISAAVSAVAGDPDVRAEMRRRQRDLIEAARRGPGRGCVAEGRDITTVVAPDADVRILLTADERARLSRRALELHGTDDPHALAATRDQVLRRDDDDAKVTEFRTAADGVIELDSSNLDFEQTVDAVLTLALNARTRTRTGTTRAGTTRTTT